MAKYRKKPVIIDAYQWDGVSFGAVETHPAYLSHDLCKHCNVHIHKHGWINSHIVCPNDWIITKVTGEKDSCKPDIFEMTYEKCDGGTL